MKKMQWLGTPAEFLELVMFIDSFLVNYIDAGKHKIPRVVEIGNHLLELIDVNISDFTSFEELRMQGEPTGEYFHHLLKMWDLSDYYKSFEK